MRKIVSLPLMLAVIGFIFISLTGCEVDYYQEPEDNQDQGSGSSLFGDGVTVPSGFDWATMRTVNIRVTVDDQYNGNYFYTVELFDGHPIFDEKATLLSKGVAKKNNDFSVAVALPQALETVFIQQTDPTGGKTIAAVGVTSPSLGYEFTTVAATTRSSSVSVNETGEIYSLRGASDQYTLPDPGNYTEITQSSGQLQLNLNAGPYLINGNFSGTFNAWGHGDISVTGEIYVTGTLEVTGQLQIPANAKLIVLEDGTVKTGGVLEVLGGSILYNNGTLEANGGLKISGNGKITNNSSIDAQSLTFAGGGTFENNGTTTIDDHTEATSNTVNFINNSSFTTNTMKFTTSAKLQNNCHLVVKEDLDTDGVTLSIGDGALLTTAKIDMNNTRVELGSAAMVNITTLATFRYNLGPNHGFHGTGANKALLKIAEAVQQNIESYPIIHYQGNLEIECYRHPAEDVDAWNKRWTQSGVTWAGEGGSKVRIPATGCNDGGNNNTPPGTPENPVFPIIFDGSPITYLFEDNWPYLGDYDMNDLVLDVQPTYSLNSSNKVTELELDVTLRAVGATKRLAVGIQLDGIKSSNVQSFSRSNSLGINSGVFAKSDELEGGQEYAVIPVFDDAHLALGSSSAIMINTISGSPNTESPVSVTFAIEFNTPLEQASITVDKFNVFIINGGYSAKRQEIHMAGFQPTDKADKSKFGHGDDNSTATTPYISKNNMIWGLAVPGPASYPNEWTSISNAYTYLKGWATSAGLDNKDWYKYPDEGKIFGN